MRKPKIFDQFFLEKYQFKTIEIIILLIGLFFNYEKKKNKKTDEVKLQYTFSPPETVDLF